MSCDVDTCDLGGYEGEPADLYSAIMRRARKSHKCYECKRVINAGDRYQLISGRWEGEWLEYKFCADCVAIAEAFACGDNRTFGQLWDDIRRELFPVMGPACLAKVQTDRARAFLRREWAEWKGLA